MSYISIRSATEVIEANVDGYSILLDGEGSVFSMYTGQLCKKLRTTGSFCF